MLTRPRPAIRRITATLLLFMVALHGGPSFAQAAGPLPKWGRATSETDLGIGDQKFLADADRQYQGDRPKASAAISTEGWKLLRQGKSDAAMLRFNQAWLLHASNGNALWGMGQIAANRGQAVDSLKLFAQANHLIGFDLDFAVDYARALSLGDKKLSDEAFQRFAQIQARAPQHTLNLQNWVIAFFYAGQYAAAWDKIKAAQTTPRGAEVDKKFLADLQGKMPRP